MKLSDQLSAALIDVPDFPKPGILFKDITPIFRDIELSKKIIASATELIAATQADVIVGLESRGFPMGFAIALAMNKPFVMIRKKGKLPRPCYQVSYDLEYGQATMELQKADLQPGQKVYIHDDLLATGGTAAAAAKLIQEAGATLVGFGFLMDIQGLNGQENLTHFGVPIHTFVTL
jgi:adenine phosphoribosyltransferase